MRHASTGFSVLKGERAVLMSALIEVVSMSKQFGTIQAVNSVSFSVDRGEVLGFLGPNGAGKSTTMRVITGFLAPNSGRASICGYDLSEDPIKARAHLGYLPEGAPLYGDMTAIEFLRFAASVRGLSTAKSTERINWVVTQLGLGPVLVQPIETLSKGFKRRVGLAQSVLHDPDVLILDEPTDGLDPNQKHEVRSLIRTMSAEKGIIISTHLLEEVDAVCTRAMVINRGKVIVDCTPEELASRSRHRNAVTVCAKTDSGGDLRVTLEGLSNVLAVEPAPIASTSDRFVAFPRDGKSIVGDITRHLLEKGWDIESLDVDSGRLDEVFRELTTGDALTVQ